MVCNCCGLAFFLNFKGAEERSVETDFLKVGLGFLWLFLIEVIIADTDPPKLISNRFRLGE